MVLAKNKKIGILRLNTRVKQEKIDMKETIAIKLYIHAIYGIFCVILAPTRPASAIVKFKLFTSWGGKPADRMKGTVACSSLINNKQ